MLRISSLPTTTLYCYRLNSIYVKIGTYIQLNRPHGNSSNSHDKIFILILLFLPPLIFFLITIFTIFIFLSISPLIGFCVTLLAILSYILHVRRYMDNIHYMACYMVHCTYIRMYNTKIPYNGIFSKVKFLQNFFKLYLTYYSNASLFHNLISKSLIFIEGVFFRIFKNKNLFKITCLC